MKKVFFIFFLISMGAQAANWKLFYLQTISDKNVKAQKIEYDSFCTGTLLNIEGSCRLITNAHCFKRDFDWAFVMTSPLAFPEYSYDLRLDSPNKKSSYDFFQVEKDFLNLTLVVKRFVTKDLAELVVTKELLPYCKDLKPIDLKAAENLSEKSQAYAAVGYYMSQPSVYFSHDVAWKNGKGKTTPTLYASSLNLKSFYAVSGVSSYRGMSGGLLIDEKSRPVGIVTRNRPYQQTSYVIGMDEVAKFLQEKSEPLHPHQEIFSQENYLLNWNNSSGPVGENGHGHGGENGHGHGGENGHGNGGENGHGHGADDQVKSKPKLSLFRMAPEGVIDPNETNRIILNKCGEQIDGYDDYIRLKSCQDKIISRPRQGESEDGNGFGLMERMFGNLSDKVLKGRGHTPFFVAHERILDQWQKITNGETNFEGHVWNQGSLRIWVKKSPIYYIFDYEKKKIDSFYDKLFIVMFSYGVNSGVQATFNYAKETPNGRGGTILSDTRVKLKCSTKNYLKLICWDPKDGIELGISKKSATSDRIEFQIAMRSGLTMGGVDGYELVSNYYGELKIDEKGKLSDLPQGYSVLLDL